MRRLWVGVAAVSALGVIVWLLIQAWRGPFITAPESPVTDSERFEKVQSEVSRFIRSTVGRGVAEWDRALIAGALTEDFEAQFPAVGEGTASQELGFRVLSLSWSGRSAIDIDAFLDRLENHVSAAGKITRCDFDCYEFLLDPSGESAAAAYHWNVGGRHPDGRAVELQADLKVEVVRVGDDWRIRRLAVERATWIESDLTPFVDVSGETGFSFPYTPQARQVIQAVIDNNRGSTIVGGLSVVDWNRDGFPDIIASHAGRRAVLFLNDGEGGFTPQRMPYGAPFFQLYLDLDGDGREELVTTGEAASKELLASLELYSRKRGHWALHPMALIYGSPPPQRPLGFAHITAGDVDEDGLVDLFVSGYANSQSRLSDRFNWIDAKDGQRNLLFINQGSLRFSEEAMLRGIDVTQYTWLSKLFDIDDDGDLDLFVINDFGPNVFYRNVGKGRFEADASVPFAQGTTYGMGLAIADYDNTGAFSFYFSNMYSHAGRRMLPLAPKLKDPTRSMLLFTSRGNTLYGPPAGGWIERAEELGVHNAGWAWGCVFFDFDNDGDKDLYVVNGFTSHSDPDAADF